MRNLAKQYRIAMIFCLIVTISTGCVATYQNVNADLLEQNSSNTFKIGVVKAVGDPMAGIFGSSGLEYKKRALDSIPIAEICSILSSKYSITIDTNVDKTPKVVKEAMGSCVPFLQIRGSTGNNPQVRFTKNIYSSIDDVYYGNLEYENVDTLGIMLFGCPEIVNNKDFPAVVNVIYSLDYGWKESFFYDINIVSSGQMILNMHGIVGEVTIPDSQADRWNSYADYAGLISKALKRDLFETVKTTNDIPAQDINDEIFKKDLRPF